VAFCVLRGLTGIGAGYTAPNTIALLTITFPPGRIRNILIRFFAAIGSIGAAGGSVFAGLVCAVNGLEVTVFLVKILKSSCDGFTKLRYGLC
jgi:MFS family permease